MSKENNDPGWRPGPHYRCETNFCAGKGRPPGDPPTLRDARGARSARTPLASAGRADHDDSLTSQPRAGLWLVQSEAGPGPTHCAAKMGYLAPSLCHPETFRSPSLGVRPGKTGRCNAVRTCLHCSHLVTCSAGQGGGPAAPCPKEAAPSQGFFSGHAGLWSDTADWECR